MEATATTFGVTLRIYSVGDSRKPEMTIGTNYSIPVQVNGYLCKNCTDVDLAKKHIDPAHPRSGPYGINAKDDPTANKTAAVIFGGALSSFNTKLSKTDVQTTSNSSPGVPLLSASGSAILGAQLDLLA